MPTPHYCVSDFPCYHYTKRHIFNCETAETLSHHHLYITLCAWYCQALIWWTDQDLNLEPHRYERRALTKLSYQSITWYHTLELNQKHRAYETQAMNRIVWYNGSPGSIRTNDPRVNSSMLLPLSYRGIFGVGYVKSVASCH